MSNIELVTIVAIDFVCYVAIANVLQHGDHAIFEPIKCYTQWALQHLHGTKY